MEVQILPTLLVRIELDIGGDISICIAGLEVRQINHLIM
jgi:hypothetical protein